MKPKKENLPLLILLTASLLIGILTIHDYGESWDEYNFYNYAEESLSAYAGIFQPDYKLEFHDPTLRYYGAGFLMFIVQTAKLFPNWVISDVGHLLTFFVFQIGITLLYFLSRRWMKSRAALGVSLLFASQPLFWGHAFFNSRDIPFMVGFIATIYFGLQMSDSLIAMPKRETPPKVDVNPIINSDWQKLSKRMRSLLPVANLIGFIAILAFSIFLSSYWLEKGLPNTDTTSARDLDIYLRPLLAKFWAAMSFFALNIFLLAGLYLPFMPRLKKYLWEVELKPIYELLKSLLLNKKLHIASFALGLTVAIRIMGFAAAGLVGVLHLLRAKETRLLQSDIIATSRKKEIFRSMKEKISELLVYGLLSLPVVYITWPYIWGEPLLRLAITLKVMMRFPWPGQILYDGGLHYANLLPWHYLPKLISLQLTEPVLFLLLLGTLALLYAKFQKIFKFSSAETTLKTAPKGQIIFFENRFSYELPLLAILWFLLPLVAAIITHPYIYDNFRHVFFTLPPIFLIAGLGIEIIFNKISKPLFQYLLLCLFILPGIIGGVKLHPYEYIYYNQFIGGTEGAFRQYEMDYWGTALRETAEFVNENIEKDAKIVVWGPATVLWRYARPDLNIYDFRQEELPNENFYVVISSRVNRDLLVYPDVLPIYILEKNGAVLAVLKYIE